MSFDYCKINQSILKYFLSYYFFVLSQNFHDLSHLISYYPKADFNHYCYAHWCDNLLNFWVHGKVCWKLEILKSCDHQYYHYLFYNDEIPLLLAITFFSALCLRKEFLSVFYSAVVFNLARYSSKLSTVSKCWPVFHYCWYTWKV